MNSNEILDEQIAIYEKAVGMVWAWTLQDPAVREDALLEFDLIERDVQLRDAEEIIEEDSKDPNGRLSFDTFDVWDMVAYDEASGLFDIRKDRIQEAVKTAISLMDEFRQD